MTKPVQERPEHRAAQERINPKLIIEDSTTHNTMRKMDEHGKDAELARSQAAAVHEGNTWRSKHHQRSVHISRPLEAGPSVHGTAERMLLSHTGTPTSHSHEIFRRLL